MFSLRERERAIGDADASIRRLIHAVRPEEQRGTLNTRERFNATQALTSLASLARKKLNACLVVDSLYESQAARAALAQVHSISIRIVAEAWGAALAATDSRHLQTVQPTSASSAAPKEGSAAAWTEALQCSSKLLSCLSNRLVNCIDPVTVDLLTGEVSECDADSIGALQGRDQRPILDAAAALLCTDYLEALSRLLAAEEHRGPNAVLDTDAVMDAIGVLPGLVYAASQSPPGLALPSFYSNSRAYNGGNGRSSQACCAAPQAQGPQPELTGEPQGHRPEPEKQKGVSWVVLEALARSSAVEHVCRFTVQRLAGADRRTGLPSKAAAGHLRGVLSLLDSVGHLSMAPSEGGASAADAVAVLLSSNIQYLLHLHVVSQLHAVDGSTTYGLPYDELLPPMRSLTGEAKPDSPALLDCQGIKTALRLWKTALELGGSASWPSGMRPKSLMELLMRTAQVALDSWEQGARARATGEQREVGQQLLGGAGHVSGGGGGGLTPSHSSNGGSAVAGCGALLDLPQGPGLALKALNCSKCLLYSHHPCDGGVCGPRGRGGCGSGGASGSNGIGGEDGVAAKSRAPMPNLAAVAAPGGGQAHADGLGGGASDGSSSVLCDDGEGNGDSTSSASASGGSRQQPWLSWARRRRFAGRWWLLLVRAVHAELDADWTEEASHNIVRCILAVSVPTGWSSWSVAAACPGGSSPAPLAMPGPSRLPACWLSAAVSAEYIPCLERLIRSAAAEARLPTTLLASRGPLVLALLEGRSLAALAACGEERQAAALLVTAIKATVDLAVNCSMRRVSECKGLAIESFAAIPGALVDLTLELLQRTRVGSDGGDCNGATGVGGAGWQSTAPSPGASKGASGGSGEDTLDPSQRSAAVPAPEAGAEQHGGSSGGGGAAAARQQPTAQQQLNKLLRLVSLCLARWLPLSAVMLWAPEGEEEHPARRHMLRLVELAQGTAEGRGDARGAESWAQLLGMSGKAVCGMGQDMGGSGGQQRGPVRGGEAAVGTEGVAVERGLEQLAALLLPPCDVGRQVLPVCSNTMCMNLAGDSEAEVQLVACGGLCGRVGCDGALPCRCAPCVAGAQT